MTAPAAHDDLGQIVSIAQTLMSAGAHEHARTTLTKALAQHPNDPSLLRELGRAEVRLKQWDWAAAHAYAALAQQPHDADAMRIYAIALSRLGRHPDALWMAWRAVQTDPNSYMTHLCYAQLLKDARQPQTALPVAAEAVRLQPGDPDTWAAQADILRALGRIADSDAAYRQALALQPDHAVAVHNMAINRLSQGRLSDALNGFFGAGRIEPELGALVRNNIASTLGKAVRRATLLATATGALMVFADNDPGAVGRTTVAVAAAALLGVTVYFSRRAPWRTWRSTVATRQFLVLPILHVAVTILAAIAVAAAPQPNSFTYIAGPLVMLSGMGLLVLSRVVHY